MADEEQSLDEVSVVVGSGDPSNLLDLINDGAMHRRTGSTCGWYGGQGLGRMSPPYVVR
ncbi:hypothetical protein [Streptomyces sp. NPDC058621]|uniref:hypothetical protein n=1 Tax=Streptomyces sp. NPDC058621 TaxID=3346561 RepID=UPI00364D7E53